MIRRFTECSQPLNREEVRQTLEADVFTSLRNCSIIIAGMNHYVNQQQCRIKIQQFKMYFDTLEKYAQIAADRVDSLEKAKFLSSADPEMRLIHSSISSLNQIIEALYQIHPDYTLNSRKYKRKTFDRDEYCRVVLPLCNTFLKFLT